ncbi:hypothetical protein GOQ27_08720 [Clostridium sp. D2Q-11]|uniref:histidine kinase n=1 Tax=Anaeromonas frigoriresistens TaxID=2683708 RepID=A0A942USR8_9FIRM|nr:hypothetical protein [Anaeromonas frigoriresistens]
MGYLLEKILYINKKQSEETKILIAYRYLSLIVTSLFYIFSNTDHSFNKRSFIVACIFISSFILNYLYIKNRESKIQIKFLVLIETIGNSIILIPSGGINSPFVWYSLNTILITSIELERLYSWINLFVYLFASLAISDIFITTNTRSFMGLVWEESNLILSLVLITALARFLSKYILEIKKKSNKLENTNKQLLLANEKIKESMNYTMELYHAVELFSHQKDKENLVDHIINYTKKITKSSQVIFSIYGGSNDEVVIHTEGIDNIFLEKLKVKILDINNIEVVPQIPIEIKIENNTYLFSLINSHDKSYGVLGIDTTDIMKNDINDLYYQLKFLSELTSIVLERFELDEVNGRLLKAEEQNRIASEIHDGVLQRLFSISCGIFTLMKRKKKAPNEDITEELNQMRSSIDDTMKELRKTIYGLSWSKEGSDNFISDINNYIDEIKRLTTINIKFKVQGKSEVLSTLHKKAFYRVIREGISNGIRHGGAKNIDINLYIYRQQTLLEIIDDGTGFDIKEIRNKKDKGIGIENMYHLVNSLKGQIYFDSIKERGTIISIKVPNVHVIEREEVV